MRERANGAELLKFWVGINLRCRMQCDVEIPKLAWNKLAQAPKIICLWQEEAQCGLIYCAAKHGSKMDKLEESTSRDFAYTFTAKQAIWAGHLNSFTLFLTVSLAARKANWWQCDTSLWGTQILGVALPQGGSCCSGGGCGALGTAGTKLRGPSINAGLAWWLFHVFCMDSL